MPHVSTGNPDSPPVRLRVIDMIWLDATLDQLRHAYRHNPTKRDKALLALILILIGIMAAL